MSKTLNLNIPNKLIQLYQTIKRYIIIFGGRGSSKSWSVADFLITKSLEKRIRVLCVREIQNSIKDSVHKLISDRIRHLGLEKHFIITDKEIKGINGSEFIFRGVYRNIDNIKSIEGIDYVWVEEAHSISRKSLEVLIPTIRKEGSQIIFTYNPTNEDDPVHEDFTLKDRDDALKIQMNFTDNPFFPEVLRSDMEYCKEYDYDKYRHIWLGECVIHSEEQVFFNKWEIQDFETPEGAEFYHGLDFGFSVDPVAAVRSYIKDDCLYIDREACKVGLEITDTAEFLSYHIPTIKIWKTIGDSARPEMISHLKNINGFNVVGSRKGKGSVEDGIEKIRGFKRIYIHSRCKNTIDEFRFYKYKKNQHTGDILPIPEDKHNHIIDALRYSLENYNRNMAQIIIPDRRIF